MQGRVVLITGCSTGMGLETARRFAQSGAQVFAAIRNVQDRGPMLEAIADDLPGSIVAVELDICDGSAIEQVVAAIIARSGRIDVLVNNAGTVCFAPLEHMPQDEHRLVFETNYFGPYRLMQAVLPHMRAAGSGTIVNISSIADRIPIAGSSPYCASKSALAMASAVLAYEAGPLGIRVAVVVPGQVNPTEIVNKAGARMAHDLGDYAPAIANCLLMNEPGALARTAAADAAEVIFAAACDPATPLRTALGEDAQGFLDSIDPVPLDGWIATAVQPHEAVRAFVQQAFAQRPVTGPSGLDPFGRPLP